MKLFAITGDINTTIASVGVSDDSTLTIQPVGLPEYMKCNLTTDGYIKLTRISVRRITREFYNHC
jgi:hypothetical protein